MKYCADFETTTAEDDCRVWGFGVVNIDDLKEIEVGNSIDQFMGWCQSSRQNKEIYFHNLKFDGEFIISWLLNNGYEYSEIKRENTFSCLISSSMQFYSIEVIYKSYSKRLRKTTFYDSLKKLPFSVARVAKAFHLPISKLEIDYNEFRAVGHKLTDHEIEYIKADVIIMAMALKQQFEQGLTKMTIGSDALHNYKESIGGKDLFLKNFPVLPFEIDKDMRYAYRGGFTYLNPKYASVDVAEGVVFDVNSLYPSVMALQDLPFGTPIHFKGMYEKDDLHPLYIQMIEVAFKVKEDHIPTIQIKGGFRYRDNEYIVDTMGETEILVLTNIDLKLFMEHYDIEYIEYISGWKFQKAKGMFKDYIEYWSSIKERETGAMRELAKLMLNSLYGKFATNPNVTGKYPVLNDKGVVQYKMGEETLRDPVYTPMGVFITSWARYITISSAQKVYDRFIYADTDSLHLVGSEIPDNLKIHPTKIGLWNHEATFTWGRFIRQKTYAEEIDGVLHVTASGMPDTVKGQVTKENFHIGFESVRLGHKRVKGGAVLVDRPFKIKLS